MEGIHTIIWDWNGTLFDDVDICIESINHLLQERNLPRIDKTTYLEVFDFPVQDYYGRIGFDFEKEPFTIPANQFIELYSSNINKAKLHQSAIKALTHFANLGFRQLILSASEQVKLNELIINFKIDPFFEYVAGLDHDYATSKVDIGIEMLKKLNIPASATCLIGDTIHDSEVAKSIGCECILIANGHQKMKKLETTGATVLEGLDELLEVFKSQIPCENLPGS